MVKDEKINPKFFYCYLDNETLLNHLTNEQAGILWKCLFAYTNRGEKYDDTDPIVAMAFDFMVQRIDREFDKYRNKCEQNRANASSRKQSKAIADDGTQYKEEEKEEEKEKYKEEKEDKEDIYLSTGVDATSHSFYRKIVNSFNSICVTLPNVKKLTDSRKRKLKNFLSNLGDISVEDYFAMVESSDFLTGRTGKWTGCNFDWVIKPENITKVIEGSYLNEKPSIYEEVYTENVW